MQASIPTKTQNTQTPQVCQSSVGLQAKPALKSTGTQVSTPQPATTQASPSSTSSKESESFDTRPKMLYKNKIVPIHADACDLIPHIAYYQPTTLVDRVMLCPVEYDSDGSYTKETKSASAAKKTVIRTIQW